jgi:general stress protein 26
MNPRTVTIALTAMIAFSPIAKAQKPQGAPPSRADILKAAREVIVGAGYATLATIGDDGQPQARIMEAFPPEPDLTVWMATTAASRKVTEIRKNPRVTLLYFDRTRLAYVTLIGRADLVTDTAEKVRRWKKEWKGFYKDENRGDDYLLIRMTPSRLEISSPGQGMMNDPATWRPVTLELHESALR